MRGCRTLLLASVMIATGCTSYRTYREAEIASQLGRWDDAVVAYLKALESDPSNLSIRTDLLRAKIRASQEHFKKGKDFRSAGVLDRSLIELQQAVQLDPTNQYAQAELEGVRRALAAQNREVPTLDELKAKNRGTRPQPPQLNPRSNQPISLDFPQPVSIFDIYRALAKAYGINVLFDPNLKDQEIAIELKDVTAQNALEVLMRSAGHFYKVLDEGTILIAADTPQNRRTYEDLVIQTFFLSNADVKDMTTILRSLIDARKIATNESLNAIILRDTADKVKVAEKIIEANDKSKAEVVIDVELLQVNTGRLRELGMALSSTSITQSLDLGTGSAPSALRLSDLQYLNQSNWVLTIPNFLYNFVKTNSDAQLLAKPQLRISEGEKASLVIGDRVPIPLTQFSAQTPGQGGLITAPITSFQYQDVGIRLDIEPRVHHNREITLKIKVEVSDISREIQAAGGQSQPVIGTRTIDTKIRLKDGETNFLAGLLRTDEKSSESGIPGLSEIPVLGRLFSNKKGENQRQDVILTLTPHIIRNAEITEEDLLPIWVGTEANISFRGGSPRIEGTEEGPFDGNAGTPEEIQDVIRRRLQQLPRGLRPEDAPSGLAGVAVPQDQQQQVQPPPQPQFAPTPTAPTDIFKQDAVKDPAEAEPPPGVSELEEQADQLIAAALSADGQRVLVARRQAAAASEAALASTAISGVATNGEPAVRLSLSPERADVRMGERLMITLDAATLVPVGHLPVTLRFDPAVLRVERVEPGDFLGDPSRSQVLSDSSHPGELVLGASQLGGGPGVAGSGIVARIIFRAVGEGSSAVSFVQGEAKDPALRQIGPVRLRPAQITVGGSEPEGGDGRGGHDREPPAVPLSTPPPSAPSKKAIAPREPLAASPVGRGIN
ncbi:MAG TPA: secretin N-terminal domain-containing protein [Thermoanaerobaculia bacterium]|jgi:general secretion pathway protein D|nr:secretin N-terminal domain-containing protein [Thermoanaerobaculia bacterium]